MATFPKTLKDPRTCRVFVSSPFGGFEKEREELVWKYFPQLSHLCQSRGVQFVTVDMRWGITEEAATDAQVINICLREVDRSDIFVGFYGQRYGWHGAHDEMLQKNIENALARYPWLATVKDRSVTEMEFMHGHLNKPGRLPAIFAFRDKTYDDVQKSNAERDKDLKSAEKFQAESERSRSLLEKLKTLVVRTKAKCLALNEKYSTPQEGANFVFQEIKTYLETVLLKTQIPMSKRDIDLAIHNAYMMSRVGMFVGGEGHEKCLDASLQQSGENVLIVGPTGSGKAALLSHWLSRQETKKLNHSLIYHFIGCSSDSSSIPEILIRLTTELQHLAGNENKCGSESIQNFDHQLKSKHTEISDLYREFELTLGKAAAKGNILLAVDGLGKIQNTSRIEKTLFWLPNVLPNNVTVVCTCREQDKVIIDELSSRSYSVLQVPELSRSLRQEMCQQLLAHNSKDLSVSQLQKIVDSSQTGNPLYLKTVISELCAFGKFRELTAKIDELMACQSVKELLQVFISRLESDYSTNTRTENIIEQVLCSIRVSRRGLSENELMVMHSIPSSDWSPLFFSMQHFMIEMGGLIRFGCHELAEAVDERYMRNKHTKLKYQKIVADYFDRQRKSLSTYTCIRLDDPSMIRPADELPWLLRDMGDNRKLVEVLTDLSLLGRLLLDQEFELLEIWRSTGISGEHIADLYLEAVGAKTDHALANSGQTDEALGAVLVTLMSYLNALSYFMEMASYKTAHEKVLLAEMKMMERVCGHVPKATLSRNNTTVKMKLAYLYTETGRYDVASKLHAEVLENRIRYLEAATTDSEQQAALKGLACSYHGIAMLNSKLDKIGEAIAYYIKAIEVQKQLKDEVELADSLHNLGVLYMKTGKHQQALDLCTQSLKIYQDLYFGNLPPVIGVMIGNIAVCHRNLGQVDKAEVMYKKAVDIAERAVGKQHPHVALGLMNLATLEINRQRFDKAEEYITECIQIFDNFEVLPSDPDYYKSLEKYVYVLAKVNKLPEAINSFKKLFQIAVSENFMDTCWPNVYILMVDCLMEVKQLELAHKVVLALLESKQQSQDRMYIQYDLVCQALNQKPEPEFCILKALKERPGALPLLRHAIETKFIPENSLQKILTSLDEAERVRNLGADLYGAAVTWCQEAENVDLTIGVLEHAASSFPEELTFVCGLAQHYYKIENWEKAMKSTRKMCLLEPTNPSHFLMHGDVALRSGDVQQAKNAFNDVLHKFSMNDVVISQAQKALDVLNRAESRRLATRN